MVFDFLVGVFAADEYLNLDLLRWKDMHNVDYGVRLA